MILVAIYIAVLIGIIDYLLVYRETVKNDKLRQKMGEPKYGTSTYIIMNCNLAVLTIISVLDSIAILIFNPTFTGSLFVFAGTVAIAYVLVRLLEVAFIIMFKHAVYARTTRKQKEYDKMKKQLENMQKQQESQNETDNSSK